MGIYYQVANYDKQELIDLYAVTNIKYSAFSNWSLQSAILNVFLGFGSPYFGSRYDMTPWVGRWKLDRIQIQSDADDDSDTRDDQQENWPDAGMHFLLFLHDRGWLDEWLVYVGWKEHWLAMNSAEDLLQWRADLGTTGNRPLTV
jgi:hypothetical protein